MSKKDKERAKLREEAEKARQAEAAKGAVAFIMGEPGTYEIVESEVEVEELAEKLFPDTAGSLPRAFETPAQRGLCKLQENITGKPLVVEDLAETIRPEDHFTSDDGKTPAYATTEIIVAKRTSIDTSEITLKGEVDKGIEEFKYHWKRQTADAGPWKKPLSDIEVTAEPVDTTKGVTFTEADLEAGVAIINHADQALVEKDERETKSVLLVDKMRSVVHAPPSEVVLDVLFGTRVVSVRWGDVVATVRGEGQVCLRCRTWGLVYVSYVSDPKTALCFTCLQELRGPDVGNVLVQGRRLLDGGRK